MIEENIAREFPKHKDLCCHTDQTLYLADYTNQTDNLRGVEVFESTPPGDIQCFELENKINLPVSYIVFDNSSFTSPGGLTLSQCECVFFPKSATVNSWILFVELKYSEKSNKNNKNLRKAIRQLYRTRTYYYIKGIFSKSNTCYMVASLPLQAEPFAQSVISPMDLTKLKSKHNVILRMTNSASIKDNQAINL
jgi:hypothetical protein